MFELRRTRRKSQTFLKLLDQASIILYLALTLKIKYIFPRSEGPRTIKEHYYSPVLVDTLAPKTILLVT